MPIDPYAPCPGGTGKKVKFCCADLVTELDKVQRMLEGDQRAACLDHIESIEGKYPERACLMSIKAMLQAQLGQEQKADETLARFVEKYPDNPVALAEQATMKAAEEGGVAAVARLQDALERCDEQIPAQVYDAIGMVAQALIAENQLLAARAHLVLQVGMTGTKDEQPLQLLMRLNSSTSVPLLAKQDWSPVPPPDDALWKKSFNEALSPAMRGAWRKAVTELVELAAKVGDWPTIWRNIAVLRTWLADTPGAIAAWQKYSAQPIPLDDAIEAEALAQSIDPEAVDLVAVLSMEYGVKEMEVLQARLTANPRALQMPIDLARMGTEDSPPPKGAFWLLSRAVPESGRELAPADVPQVVGQAFIYGKQTDRAARLELAAYRTQLTDAQAALAEVAGDSLGEQVKEEISTEVPALQHALTTNWRLPEDTSPEKRLELIKQQRRDILLNHWPNMSRRIFGGKSAADVAGDPAQRIKLLAAILLLELATDQVASDFDFNELRRKLGVPEAQPIDPAASSLAELPLARMSRVDVKKLTDEQLVDLYQRADHCRHIAALRHLAHEVIARPGLDDKIEKAEVYGLLAQIEPDSGQAVSYLDQARAAAEATKKSTAPWDLAELALRISRGEVADADRLLHHIRDQHIREPGVAQALYQILTEAGIIGPDGRPSMPPGAGPQGAEIGAPGAGAEAGKLWTPGSDEPSSGKKSAIWTPD
jgi:tetratricopeptide (TPR) repeat protein